MALVSAGGEFDQVQVPKSFVRLYPTPQLNRASRGQQRRSMNVEHRNESRIISWLHRRYGRRFWATTSAFAPGVAP